MQVLASSHRNQAIQTAHRTAALLHHIGKDDEACEGFRIAMQSPDEQTRLRAAIDLGIVHAKRGDYDEALGIWQQVTDAARDEFARQAAFNSALVLDKIGETSKAIRDLKYAMVATDARVTGRAQEVLRQLRNEGWDC